MFQKISNFIKEIKQEMAKVSWPSRAELKDSTVIVILISMFFAIYIYGLDKILTGVIKIIYPYK